jgi:hypothetical protein
MLVKERVCILQDRMCLLFAGCEKDLKICFV